MRSISSSPTVAESRKCDTSSMRKSGTPGFTTAPGVEGARVTKPAKGALMVCTPWLTWARFVVACAASNWARASATL